MVTSTTIVNGIANIHQWTVSTGADSNINTSSRISIRTRSSPAGRVKPSGPWIAPTNATFSESFEKYPYGFWSIIPNAKTSQKTRVTGSLYYAGSAFQWGHALTPTIRTESSLTNEALTKVLNRVKDSKVNLAQAFAERKQTARLFASTAKRIASSFRSLKRGDVAGALRGLGSPSNRGRLSTRDIADQWLEIQYGWKPLLSDLYGAVEVLRQKDSDRQRYYITAKQTARDTVSSSDLDDDGQWVGTIRTTKELSVFVRLDYYVSCRWASSLSQLGISNPLALAWELVPWSFVVDWFVPIGGYLSSLDATSGLSFLGGSKSVRSITESTIAYTRIRVPSPASVDTISANGTKMAKTITRTVYLSSPAPGALYTKNPLSYDHVSNALALLRGAFKR